MDVTNTIERCYGFLEHDFGCRVVETRRGDPVEAVTYANETTFVRVTLERDVELYVQFGPLRDGAVPPYGPGWYDVLMLVDAMNEPRPDCVTPGFARGDLQRCLEEHADALRRAGSDVLNGDFEVVPELQAMIRANLENQHPRG